MTKFKIQEVTTDAVTFTNGKKITYDHQQDCCEYNYADFKQIDDLAYDIEFTEPLLFEQVEEAGFRFGNVKNMVFVPCYSEQNGYYDDTVEIVYDGKIVLYDCIAECKLY